MEMGPTKYKSWKSVEKQFEKKSCTEGVSTVQHEKMMPNCKNVTKLNCVTLWKTDEDGKQVRKSSSLYFSLLQESFIQ